MNKVITLTKVLLRNGNAEFNKSGLSSKKKKGVLSKITGIGQIILMLLIFTPFAFSLYAAGEQIYYALKPLNQQSFVLSFGISSSIMLVFIFGIIYSINVYYFSNDLEIVLPLPFKSSEIVLSKFLTVLMYEYLTVLILFSPYIVLYGVKEGITFTYVLYSIIVFLFIPIIPLSLSGVLCMLIMSFTPFIKNKERFRFISSIVVFGFVMVMNVYMQSFQGGSDGNVGVQRLVTSGNMSIIMGINKYILTNTFAIKSLIFNREVTGVLNLILFISVSMLMLYIFIIFAENLYFKGAVGSTEVTSKRRLLTHSEISKGSKGKSQLYSYYLKELRLLMRSPVYFLNCVLMDFVFPLFILIPFVIQEGSFKFLGELRSMMNGNDGKWSLVLSIALGVSLIICAMGPVSASSISREGKDISFNKFIPMDYKTQILSKILSGITINFLGVIFFFIIFCFVFLPNIKLGLFILVLMSLGIVFGNLIGILSDIIHPKLLWEEEHKPVKQNFMLVIYVFILIPLAGVPSFVVINTNLNYNMIFILFSLGVILLNIILWVVIKSIGIKKLKSIEI
ncbi:hypothetical protein [Hathewaya massiliensis]|uniref:hypothetical protein n=1 Tax=Hathewaya massiliensis TaxID=1964382 RepID=UPI00115BD0CA|nr:hypothetical protein [Hathewaya massiliensis]